MKDTVQTDKPENTEKELKKFLKPLHRFDKWDLLHEFEMDRAKIDFECNCINCNGGRFFIEEQLDKSVSLSKRSIPVQQLIESGVVDKNYLHDWTFHINEDYIIARHSGIEYFFKIERGMLENSETSIDNIRAEGFETYEDYCNRNTNRESELSNIRKKTKSKNISRNL